jgi:hypothetical protein
MPLALGFGRPWFDGLGHAGRIVRELNSGCFERASDRHKIVRMRDAVTALEIPDGAIRYLRPGRQVSLGPIQPSARRPALFR